MNHSVQKDVFPTDSPTPQRASLSPSHFSLKPTQFPLNPIAESFYHLSTLMNTHSCEWLQIQGRVDPDLLTEAIILVQKRHPLTRARLIKPTRFKRAQWIIHPQNSPSSPPLWIHSLWSPSIQKSKSPVFNPSQSGHFPLWLTRFIWQRPAIDPTRNDPVEFHLFYETNPSTSSCQTHLLILAPHLCTDARAGMLLLKDLAYFYSLLESSLPLNTPLEPLSSFDEDLLTRLNLSQLPTSSFSLSSLIQGLKLRLKGAWGLFKDLIQPAQGLDFPSIPRGETSAYVHRVPQAQLKQVLKSAKRAQTTAHVPFTWGLVELHKRRHLKAYPHKTHVPLFRVADLFSLCPWLDQATQNHFDVLIQPYTTTLNPQWSRKYAFSHLNKILQNYKRGDVLSELPRVRLYTAFARLFPYPKLKAALLSSVFKTNLTTTNPGRVPIHFDSFGSLPCLDFINFPQISPPARFGIIYTTYQNQLRIVSLYDQNVMTEREVETFTSDLWQSILTLSQEIDAEERE